MWIGASVPTTAHFAAITPLLLHDLQEFHKQELANYKARQLLVPNRARRK
jgi:hypothetical protein